MSVNSKMTAIADEIRELSGVTGTMGLDAMATNLGEANDEVVSQTTLIAQIASMLEGKAAGGEVEQATPVISVNSNGLITATAGTKSATKQLTTQAAKTITPSASSQTAVSSGVYTTGTVTVDAIPSTYIQPSYTKSATTYTPTTTNQTISAGTYLTGVQTIKGDSNLVASNIRNGVSIFGVSGTFAEGSSSGGYTADDFNNCTIEGELVISGTKVRSYAFYNFREVTSISAPNATTIEQYAFGYCTAATSVNFPEVTAVTTGSLRNLHAITSIVLPKVTTVNGYGMYYMINATTIDLPVCTTLDTYSLGYCNKLQNLILRSPTVCILKNTNCFVSTPYQAGKAGGYVYVPSALISEYQSATNWSALAATFRAIEDYPDICG